MKRQNEQLLRLIEAERASTEGLQKGLLSQVTKAVTNFAGARDKNIRDAIGKMNNELVDCQREVEKHKYEHGRGVDGSLTHQRELLTRLDQRASESKRIRETAGTSFKHVRSKMQNGLGQLHTSISHATASHSNTVQEEMGTLDRARAGAHERLQKGQQDRAELLQEMQADTQQTYDYLRSTLTSTSQSVQETVHGIVAEASRLVQRLFKIG